MPVNCQWSCMYFLFSLTKMKHPWIASLSFSCWQKLIQNSSAEFKKIEKENNQTETCTLFQNFFTAFEFSLYIIYAFKKIHNIKKLRTCMYFTWREHYNCYAFESVLYLPVRTFHAALKWVWKLSKNKSCFLAASSVGIFVRLLNKIIHFLLRICFWVKSHWIPSVASSCRLAKLFHKMTGLLVYLWGKLIGKRLIWFACFCFFIPNSVILLIPKLMEQRLT